jgi:hypothetical protein
MGVQICLKIRGKQGVFSKDETEFSLPLKPGRI